MIKRIDLDILNNNISMKKKNNMKQLLVVMLALSMLGCQEPTVDINSTKHVLSYGHNPLQEITIEDCQYLYGEWGNTTVLTHKGNCNNPIHQHNGGNH